MYAQIINLAANISVAISGFVMVWLMLRFMDKSIKPGNDKNTGISFTRDIWPQLKAGNQAVSSYYGCRVLGALIFVGLVFSRVPF